MTVLDSLTPHTTLARLDARETLFEVRARPARERLLESPLVWTLTEKAIAEQLRVEHRALALASADLATRMECELGPRDERTRLARARAVYHLGETVKHDVFAGITTSLDYALLHGLMRASMEAGQHRDSLTVPVEGRPAECTVEFLYFRALLLARFSSGALNARQIDILDAWMWLWMPVLRAVTSAPAGSALRADLDSCDGLRRGPRSRETSSLYLPQEPIEGAFRTLVASFHDGRIVPETGRASRFRLEEHIAVLDLIRAGLKDSRRKEVIRAERREVGKGIEFHLGIGEAMEQAFLPAPPSASVLTLAPLPTDAPEARALRDRDLAPADIYRLERRQATILNESATGLALEGNQEQFSGVSTCDLVGFRTGAHDELELGKVVRTTAAKASARVVVGVRRVGFASRPVPGMRRLADGKQEEVMLAFVQGDDAGGRRDAFLLEQGAFTTADTFQLVADGIAFEFRFNRIREEGRGWVMAGFEVIGAQAAAHSAYASPGARAPGVPG